MSRWTAADMPSLAGRSFLVTGPGGLGFETALALARHGAEVILAGRDPGKGGAACENIRSQVPNANVEFELLDLANLASVRAFATRLQAQRGSLDVLINNAGVMAPPARRTTPDGFELQMGTNHFGHFALTGLLLPLLRAGRAPRVVTVSSLAHRRGRICFDDLQFERAYKPWDAYSQSKLANLLFAFELQRRSDANGWGLMSLAAHPGTSKTDLIANQQGRDSIYERIGKYFYQPAWQGALPTLYAATSADVQPGGYYGPDGFFEMKGWPTQAQAMPAARDASAARRLWEVSEQATNVRFEQSATPQQRMQLLVS